MEIGNKIRKLRQNKGITQEILAQALGVSYQAVSRWENNLTMPDISLLPDISVYFGISIDELFEMSSDKHLERIENMLSDRETLTNREFKEAEDFLLNYTRDNREDNNAYALLADTYYLYGQTQIKTAENYAKMAIEKGNNDKSVHNIIQGANKGICNDWNYRNHHDVIKYYMELINKNPKDRRMCLYTLDYLILDGRIKEAYKVLDMIKAIDKDAYIVKECKGRILRAEYKIKEAFEVWNEMVKEHEEEWIVWACMGDHYADMCEYDKAIECHEKSYQLQPQPRYLDCRQVIAHISEIRGDYDKAIEMYKEMIRMLKDEWNTSFGEYVDIYQNKIDELKKF